MGEESKPRPRLYGSMLGNWARQISLPEYQGLTRLEADRTPAERLDEPPARTSAAGAAVIVATIAFFSVLGLSTGGFFQLPVWALGVLAGLVALAVAAGSPPAQHVTILCLVAGIAYRTPGLGLHPFPLMSALMGYGLVVLTSRRLRETVGWPHTGSLAPDVRRLVIAVSLASIVTLPVWRLLAEADIALATELIARVPVGALAPVGLAFAIVNAGVEEAAFRGVLMDGLRSAVGVWGALVLQAVAFGLVHYAHGVPNGVAGAVISGIYGLALGLVRLRARGMLAPWIAHAVTDAAIFVLLVAWAQ